MDFNISVDTPWVRKVKNLGLGFSQKGTGKSMGDRTVNSETDLLPVVIRK